MQITNTIIFHLECAIYIKLISALPQTSPHVQAAHRLLSDGHPPRGVPQYPGHLCRPDVHCAHVCPWVPLPSLYKWPCVSLFSILLRYAPLHLLSWHHWPLRDYLQGALVAAVATWLHLPWQPSPILSCEIRYILGHESQNNELDNVFRLTLVLTLSSGTIFTGQ